MKKYLLVVLTLFLSFSHAIESNFTEKFEKQSVYGRWIDIDSAKIIEITSKTAFTFERLDHDLIIVNIKGEKSYLKRLGSAKTKVSGRVIIASGGKNMLPAKNINIYMSHIQDKSLRAKIHTDNNGYFSNETLPSGSYTIYASQKGYAFKTDVTLSKIEEPLGTFVLMPKKSSNFRSTLQLEGDYLLADNLEHHGFIEISNYGDKKGNVCYSASVNDPQLNKIDFTGSCKILNPKEKITIPLSVSFKSISKNARRAIIDVHLTGANGTADIESHPITLYKEAFDFKLNTQLKDLKTYVILPNHAVKEIKQTQKSTKLPKLSAFEYQLIVANTNPRKATLFEVDIGAEEKLTQSSHLKKQKTTTESTKTCTFRHKQSIGRYPNLGDIAIYTFFVADSIVLQEDSATYRLAFSQRNHLGEVIDYQLTLSNPDLATANYTKGHLVITPKKDAHGVATITMKNKSGATFGNTNIKMFTLVVASVNDKPVITSKPFRSIVEGDVYRYTLDGTDLESKQLEKHAVKLPNWLKFSEKKGLLYGKPLAKDIGIHNITLALKDDQDSTLQSFTIKVTPKRDSSQPIFATFTTKEDTTLLESIKTRPVENATTLFTLAQAPKNGKVVLKSDGGFSYTPSSNFNGTDVFSVNYSVNTAIKTLLIAVDVQSVNDVPTAEDIIFSHVGSQPLTINWEKASHAADIDEDDLYITLKSRSALGEITAQQDTLLYTPHPNKQGSEKILLELSDKQGGTKLLWLYLYNIERGITPKVLKTGQTIIFRAQDDGVYKKSIPREYEKDLQGSVVKDMIALKTWYHDTKKTKRTFAEAKKYCRSLEVQGVEKWRLPTIEELVFIADKGRISPAINPIFSGIENDYYWSATHYKKRTDYRWVLYFDYGEDYYRHEDATLNTLCVHDGVDDLHPPVEINLNDSARTYILSTETNTTAKYGKDYHAFSRDNSFSVVSDKKAELMWYDGKIEVPTPWISAITHCENLKFAGHTDWRLPNFNELYLITDHESDSSATQKDFKNAKEASFWSSTSSENDHDRAWGISFAKGSDFTFDKAEQLFTRCVRDLK